MVSKITIFELHMDSPRFGTNETVEELDEEVVESFEEDTASDSGGPSLGRLVVMSLFVSVAATLLARRLFGDEDVEEAPIEIDTTEEPADLEIEN